MSSTRRTEDPSVFRQGRYASDPDFVALRGIEGAAALLKARRVSPRERALIFFLQSRSLDEGGLEGVVEDLIQLVPEAFGTRTMRSGKHLADGVYRAPHSDWIRSEIKSETTIQELSRGGPMSPGALSGGAPGDDEPEFIPSIGWGEPPPRTRRPEVPLSLDEARELCFAAARRELPRWIVEIAIQPRLQVLPPGGGGHRCPPPGASYLEVPYLQDLGSTLEVYRQRYNRRALSRFAKTTISEALITELEYAMETRRFVLIEGDSGVGKTESAKAWFDRNRDRARYLTLSGISNRTTLCRAIASALGLPKSMALSATKILPRIEEFLRESRLMLIVDEAHHLWSHSNRPDRAPELINWLMTACSNHSVPVALITTEEWHRRRGNTERNTGWNAEQLARRIVRFSKLPKHPTEADFESVICAIAPDADAKARTALIVYAQRMGGSLTRMVDALADARRIAAAAGRDTVLVRDVVSAGQYRQASDYAMAPDPDAKPARRASAGQEPRRGPCTPDAPEPQGRGVEAALGQGNSFPGEESPRVQGTERGGRLEALAPLPIPGLATAG